MPLRVGKCGQTPFSVHYLSFPVLTVAAWHVVQRGGGASRRRVPLGKGMTRCFRHRSRAQEWQSPPWVAANAPPHPSHLNGTILTLAIP
jgi:hypothetical protein